MEGPGKSPADLSSPEQFLHVIGQVSCVCPCIVSVPVHISSRHSPDSAAFMLPQSSLLRLYVLGLLQLGRCFAAVVAATLQPQ